MLRFLALPVLFLGLAAGCAPAAQRVPFTGTNLAGGEFYQPKPGVRPVYGKNFTYPTKAEIDYFAGQGMNIFRVGFLWETLQAEARKPFDPAETARLKAAVRPATSRRLVVVLDPHNYARYYGKVVGGPDVSNEDFADFWRRLAGEFADAPYVWFDLTNEPQGMPTKQWFDAAQAAITAIRAAGATNLILVPGNAWSGAHSWTGTWYGQSNAEGVQAIRDPLNYWAIDVHQYLDKDSSGTKPEVAGPTVGSERLKAFVAWCRAHEKRALLGEVGVAAGPEARVAIEDMLRSMDRDRDVWLGWTWWAAGAWWGDYMFSIEPKDGKDRPQMAWLKPFLAGTAMPKYALAVKGGEGGADVEAGAVRALAAALAPAGMVFDRWTGDAAWLKDPAAAKTSVTMPFRDVAVEAAYRRNP